MADTLCWKCARSFGENQCSWASGFQPIPGWDAVPTVMKGAEMPFQSYFIKGCPDYMPEPSRTVEELILIALDAATYKQGYGSEQAVYNAYRHICLDCNQPVYKRGKLRDAITAMGCCTIVHVGGNIGNLYYREPGMLDKMQRKGRGA